MRMMTTLSRVNDAEGFQAMPLNPIQRMGGRGPAPRLAERPGRRAHLGASAISTAEVQANLMSQTPVPNWMVYSGSALLLTGGVLGLMQEEKSVFSVALGATMIGIGGFLFFQTLKG